MILCVSFFHSFKTQSLARTVNGDAIPSSSSLGVSLTQLPERFDGRPSRPPCRSLGGGSGEGRARCQRPPATNMEHILPFFSLTLSWGIKPENPRDLISPNGNRPENSDHFGTHTQPIPTSLSKSVLTLLLTGDELNCANDFFFEQGEMVQWRGRAGPKVRVTRVCN